MMSNRSIRALTYVGYLRCYFLLPSCIPTEDVVAKGLYQYKSQWFIGLIEE